MEIDASLLVDKYMVLSANLQGRVFALECQVDALKFEVAQATGGTSEANDVTAHSDGVVAEGTAA